MSEPLGPAIPIVRHFLACRSLIYEEGDVTLRGLISTIRAAAAEEFPLMEESLVLFALLTDGRGLHEFHLEFVLLSLMEEDLSIRTTRRVRIDLGQDPLRIHGLPIPIENLVLEHIGGIEIRLKCDGHEIAGEYLRVEE